MIERIVAGVIIFLTTSLILYAFRIRQLYAVVPKLHRKSFLSDGGSVAEVTIYNKGTKVEEDICLELNQEFKYELLASNNSNVTLNGCCIKVDRIHSLSDLSIILLVENGIITYDDLISLSSKENKGSFYKKIDDVPIPASYFALGVAGVVLLFSMLYWGEDIYDYLESKYVQYNYTELIEIGGWTAFGNYLGSELSESYTNQEFPIRFTGVKRKNKKISLDYEVINKSALPIKVYLMDLKKFENEGKNDFPFESVEVQPLEKTEISINYPDEKQTVIELRASIDFGEENIYGIRSSINLEKYNKANQAGTH